MLECWSVRITKRVQVTCTDRTSEKEEHKFTEVGCLVVVVGGHLALSHRGGPTARASNLTVVMT